MSPETDPAKKKQRMRPTLFKGPQPYPGFLKNPQGFRPGQKCKKELMGLILFLVILLGFILVLAR